MFCASKCNLSRLPRALAFNLTVEAQRQVARIEWCAEPVDISADELLAANDKRQERGTAQAVAWLTDQLIHGPKPSAEIERAAEANKISKRTSECARFFMRVRPKKQPGSFNNGWIMALPGCRNCKSDPMVQDENP